MAYRFTDGFRSKGTPAEVVHAELERLRAENEGLTAERVFEAARPEGSPLHEEFEWRSDEAVRQLGLIRARTLVRAIVRVPDPDEEDQRPTRVYFHVPAAVPSRPDGQYHPIAVIVQQPDAFARALDELTRKFGAAELALNELRRAAGSQPQTDRMAALATANNAFSAARQALVAIS